jgi:hypothetical protein
MPKRVLFKRYGCEIACGNKNCALNGGILVPSIYVRIEYGIQKEINIMCDEHQSKEVRYERCVRCGPTQAKRR